MAFFFSDRDALVETNRFSITLYVPHDVRAYFLPSSEWERITFDADEGIEPKAISSYKHATLAQGYPYTKSPFYTAPYFIHFKSNARIKSNYLMYNDFFKPNSYATVLGLFTYDDISDKFVPGFLTPLQLKNNNELALNNLLEFVIVDSVNQQVEFVDNCQLFVAIEITKPT